MITATQRINDPKFAEWLEKNQDIWLEFSNKADALRARGRVSYSAYTIVESIRWETDLREDANTTFKISNARIPELARLYNKSRNCNLFVLKESNHDI